MWVAPLAALAEAHGRVAVSDACLRTLGYPAVMVTDSDEVRRVEAALNDGGRPYGNDETLRSELG
jgi:hypothetical protein